MTLNTHPTDKKLMVRAISEHTGMPAVYMRLPSLAYRIGDITVTKEGSVISENTTLLESIAPMLVENGWLDDVPEFKGTAAVENDAAPTVNSADLPETPSEDNASITRIHIQEQDLDLRSMKNLIRILYTRQRLINRMLKMKQLFIDMEVIDLLDSPYQNPSDLEAMVKDEIRVGMIRGFDISDGTVAFDLPEDSTLLWPCCSQLMGAIIRQAKISSRVKTQVLEAGANEKYLANAWLNRLGFSGANFKDLRNTFMAHLNGYAAFRSEAQMQKHKDKLAEQRRIRREMNEEAHGND